MISIRELSISMYISTLSTYLRQGQPGAGGYREHDCLVIHHDGSVENVTKFPFGPEHNVVECQKQ